MATEVSIVDRATTNVEWATRNLLFIYMHMIYKLVKSSEMLILFDDKPRVAFFWNEVRRMPDGEVDDDGDVGECDDEDVCVGL